MLPHQQHADGGYLNGRLKSLTPGTPPRPQTRLSSDLRPLRYLRNSQYDVRQVFLRSADCTVQGTAHSHHLGLDRLLRGRAGPQDCLLYARPPIEPSRRGYGRIGCPGAGVAGPVSQLKKGQNDS